MSKLGGMLKYSAIVSRLEAQRDEVLSEFKRLGGKRDRWTKADWLKMAQAITRAEDALELRTHSVSVRLQTARRQLE